MRTVTADLTEILSSGRTETIATKTEIVDAHLNPCFGINSLIGVNELERAKLGTLAAGNVKLLGRAGRTLVVLVQRGGTLVLWMWHLPGVTED